MKRSVPPRRKPTKRSQPRRDWSEARAKVEAAGGMCRACGTVKFELEAAHIIGREHDFEAVALLTDDPVAVDHFHWTPWTVHPVRIVPLCRKHHRAYDAHELDLLPYLTVEEQAQAVLDAGGLELARRRICGRDHD